MTHTHAQGHTRTHTHAHIHVHAHTRNNGTKVASSCDDPYLIIATTVAATLIIKLIVFTADGTCTCMFFRKEMMVNFIELGTFLPYLEVA